MKCFLCRKLYTYTNPALSLGRPILPERGVARGEGLGWNCWTLLTPLDTLDELLSVCEESLALESLTGVTGTVPLSSSLDFKALFLGFLFRSGSEAGTCWNPSWRMGSRSLSSSSVMSRSPVDEVKIMSDATVQEEIRHYCFSWILETLTMTYHIYNPSFRDKQPIFTEEGKYLMILSYIMPVRVFSPSI